MKYLQSHINEGFNILNRRLTFTDDHEDVLNTSLEGPVSISNVFVAELNDYVKVYSIFKRCRQISRSGDSNPVIYALKKEHGWDFADEENKKAFWLRFTHLLYRFLRDHKNEFDTTIIIPSSKRINTDIAEEIKKIAKEVGITHISDAGLYTVSAETMLDSAWEENSYFRSFWKDEFDKAYQELEKYANEMEKENDGRFKYHIIDNQKLRKSILHTLDVDERSAFMYSPYINGKNIIIVDDSIAHGQTIQNAIHAISTSYVPKTISVLTMFSQLYDEKGNEINKE